MNTQQKISYKQNTKSPSIATVIGWLVAATLVGLIAYYTQGGAVSPRIANPDVTDAALAAVAGIPDWAAACNIWSTLTIVVGAIAFAIAWRRYPAHPNLLMLATGTGLVWQDPPMNWVTYVAFNPTMWHYPEDWPWMSLAPTVEPLACFAYATVLVGPAFLGMAILRRLQTRSATDSFVWRRPLISLGLITFVVGFIVDAMVEIFCVSMRIYTYTQVPTFGSIFTGHYNQFPLLWESGLVTAVMIPAAILLHRDDTGRTQAEKLAQRLRLFPRRPALASFLVMFSILNGAYFFIYGGGFLIIRAGGFATSVACPWPYPESKVYDPQGLYENSGHPGPFFEGKWNTWLSGQPAGRPIIEGPIGAGRCGPGHE